MRAILVALIVCARAFAAQAEIASYMAKASAPPPASAATQILWRLLTAAAVRHALCVCRAGRLWRPDQRPPAGRPTRIAAVGAGDLAPNRSEWQISGWTNN